MVLKVLIILIRVRVSLVASKVVPKRHAFASYVLPSDDMDGLENIKSFNSDS